LIAVFAVFLNNVYANTENEESALNSTLTEDKKIEGCFCILVYSPVCGADGKTYGNRCEAECNGVKVLYEGECKNDITNETNKIEDKNKIDDKTPLPDQSTGSLPVPLPVEDKNRCDVKSLELLIKELEEKINAEKDEAAKKLLFEKITVIKREIESCNQKNDNAEKLTDVNICLVPVELEKELENAIEKYNVLIKQNASEQEIIKLKTYIAELQEKINRIKINCVVPSKPSQPITEPKETEKQNIACDVKSLVNAHEKLLKEYKKAIEMNDTKLALSLKEKIADIENNIEKRKIECTAPEITKETTEKNIVDYYKRKIEEINKENETSSEEEKEKIEEKKAAVKEVSINLLIKVAKEKGEIEIENIKGMANEINLELNKIIIDNKTFSLNNISLKVEDKIKVKISNDSLEIEHDNIKVKTNEKVKIKDNSLWIKEKKINLLPQEAISKAKIDRINDIKLETLTNENKDSIIYNIEGKQEGKLLFIIPVEIDKSVYINAETGEIIKERKPFWSFLVG
jgi:hypothetical protein